MFLQKKLTSFFGLFFFFEIKKSKPIQAWLFADPAHAHFKIKRDGRFKNVQVDCAACGVQTYLKENDEGVKSLPMDPLIALYSAVPSQVNFLSLPNK